MSNLQKVTNSFTAAAASGSSSSPQPAEGPMPRRKAPDPPIRPLRLKRNVIPKVEVPEVPRKGVTEQEEGQANRHAVAAGDQSQEASIKVAAGKGDTFTLLAVASCGEGMSGKLDDVLEGVPAYPATEKEEDGEEEDDGEEDEEEEEDGEEEDDDDEDWQFTLPKGTLKDDDDVDSNLTEEDGRLRAGQSANDSIPVSSDGTTVEKSKEPDDNQVGKISKEQSEAPLQAPVPDAPILSVKDEPVDEGYDAALLPQSSIGKIKEEQEHKDEELRISSVFSFRGGNAFPAQGGQVPINQPTTIFIPDRSALHQASVVAPIGIRPLLPAPATAPVLALAHAPAPNVLHLHKPLPHLLPQPPPALISAIRCSGCSKVLVKGQTAFQRKGSTQLFCSTVCLSSNLPLTSKARSCYHCSKEISNPKSMVIIPLDNNTFMHFCSPLCMSSSSTDKMKTVAQLLYRPRLIPVIPKEKEKHECIVCKSTSKIEHEVSHQGQLHSLCSDACFLAWRKSRQLAMNCCEGCGLYCKNGSDVCQTLTVEKAQLHFCSPTCVSTYKQSCVKNTECSVCHNSVLVSNTIMESDAVGKVQLYCSPTCVQSGPAKLVLTGTAFPCSQCNLNEVPQYHLVTSDGNILNFCSQMCVSMFRVKKEDNSSQPSLVNGATTTNTNTTTTTTTSTTSSSSVTESPVPHLDRSSPNVTYPNAHSRVTSVPPLEPDNPLTSCPLTCYQCSKRINAKPLLFSYQGCISMFCDAACCEQYKTRRNIMAVCESCKLENVAFDVLIYNGQERVFCSQRCKRRFQEETTGGKGSWRPCSYCSGVSQMMIHSSYSGRVEEFCRPHCMSQYTVLYYGMARCGGCRKQGYLNEKLQCSNSVRNFCSRACLVQYCHQHFEASAQPSAHHHHHTGIGHALPAPHAPSQAHHPSKMNPVVGDVVSVASDSAARPTTTSVPAGALLTSNTHDKDKPIYHASTQTDAMRVPVARRCQMKNKSLLCRPFTLNQETMCQLLEPPAKATVADTATATDSSPTDPIPARLTGRHFLDVRRGGGADCVVCAKRMLKRASEGQEEGPPVRKWARMEEQEESGKVGVCGTEKVEEKSGVELPEQQQHLKEEPCNETDAKQEPADTAQPARHCGEGGESREDVMAQTGAATASQQTAYCCKICPGQPALCPAPCFKIYHTRLLYWLSAEPVTAGGPRPPPAKPDTSHASTSGGP